MKGVENNQARRKPPSLEWVGVILPVSSLPPVSSGRTGHPNGHPPVRVGSSLGVSRTREYEYGWVCFSSSVQKSARGVLVFCDRTVRTGAETHPRTELSPTYLFMLPFPYVLRAFSEGLSVRDLRTQCKRTRGKIHAISSHRKSPATFGGIIPSGFSGRSTLVC